MHARVTRLEASAERLDEMVSQFEANTVPVLEGLDGFKGYVLLGDRTNGMAMAVTWWQSEAALQASEEAVAPERDRAAQAAEAASGPTVERYEVVSTSFGRG
jgi:heme-degrading monooxygenase HmoA